MSVTQANILPLHVDGTPQNGGGTGAQRAFIDRAIDHPAAKFVQKNRALLVGAGSAATAIFAGAAAGLSGKAGSAYNASVGVASLAAPTAAKLLTNDLAKKFPISKAAISTTLVLADLIGIVVAVNKSDSWGALEACDQSGCHVDHSGATNREAHTALIATACAAAPLILSTIYDNVRLGPAERGAIADGVSRAATAVVQLPQSLRNIGRS